MYVARGLDPSLAKQVAQRLMAHDALGAHARDELGISETLVARPIQAALASACSFAVGAAMPLLVTAIAPRAGLIPLVSGTSLVFLALLGGLAARVGGAGVMAGAIRVTFWLCAGHGADRGRWGAVRDTGVNRHLMSTSAAPLYIGPISAVFDLLPRGELLPYGRHALRTRWPLVYVRILLFEFLIITRDIRHFGPYFGKKIQGILVLPPGDYLKKISARR